MTSSVLTKTRLIPPTDVAGVKRGGGSESIQYVSNGPMSLSRAYTLWTPSPGVGSATIGKFYYSGGNPSAPALTPPTESETRIKGTDAMNRSRPGYAASSALTASAELHGEGIPMIPRIDEWKNKAGALRNISKTHLAVQFGFVPLLAEIQAFARRIIHQNVILADAYKRARQNNVHVGYRFPTISTVTTAHPAPFASVNWQTGALDLFREIDATVVNTTSIDTWFEGNWQSFIPNTVPAVDEEYLYSTSNKARILLGSFISPKMLWELAPWSWFVDWFTNTGAVLDSFSNVINDGLVLRNAYVMCHSRSETYASWVGAQTRPPADRVGFGEVHCLFETKTRFPSVPYFGFGSVGELSLKQLSILAALGIAKR